MNSGRRPRSGAQYRLRAGGYEAVVASVGASLRVLRDIEGDLIAPFHADEERPSMRGALLAPWPNRTDGGRYTFRGRTHQLSINEPERRNASHGLVSELDFALSQQTHDRITLSRVLEHGAGYPWRVRFDVTFQLSATGLEQIVRATNLSDQIAPLGIGVHPYLQAGPAWPSAIDGWSLQLPADDVLRISDDRLLPIERERVELAGVDFRERRPIGAAVINHAFGALRRDDDGWVRIRVTDAQGNGVELACDAAYRWVQIYTADEAVGGDHRAAIAVEPMTCPPDALNSGIDLLALEAGAAVQAASAIRRIRSTVS
ncbi:aldose 1-epimerase family protein [Microbacterium sp. GXF0217]